jgi:hypothetical protein
MMRKTSIIIAFMALTLIYTPSASVFAASSPSAETITNSSSTDNGANDNGGSDKNPYGEAISEFDDSNDSDDIDSIEDSDGAESKKNNEGGNTSDTSPKTGFPVPALLGVLSASIGSLLAIKKKS